MLEITIELLDLSEKIIAMDHPDYESNDEIQRDLTMLAQYLRDYPYIDVLMYNDVFGDSDG